MGGARQRVWVCMISENGAKVFCEKRGGQKITAHYFSLPSTSG
jgi:hypothetical protein